MPRQHAKLAISRPRTGAMVIVLCATTVQGVPPDCLGQSAKVEKKSALPLYSTCSIGLERGGEETACHCAKRVSSLHRVNGFAALCVEVERAVPPRE